MNIKVCGITSVKQLQQLEGLDIDFAGLIFYKESPRYMGESISPDDLSGADLDIKKVGVFVNATHQEIMIAVEAYELDIVQLHGDESPAFCADLSEEIEVIKAFKIGNNTTESIDELVKEYDDACDYYLFDTAGDKHGGNGEKFDWTKITAAKIEKPFFLSGGIQLTDAIALKKFKHPDFFGVDVNSGFEKAPGVKDMAKVLEFKLAVK